MKNFKEILLYTLVIALVVSSTTLICCYKAFEKDRISFSNREESYIQEINQLKEDKLVLQTRNEKIKRDAKHQQIISDFENNLKLHIFTKSDNITTLDDINLIYNCVIETAEKYDIDTLTLFALIQKESDFIKKAKSKPFLDDDRLDCGLTQVSPNVLANYNSYNHTNFIQKDLYEINVSIEVCGWYLNYLRHEFDFNDTEMLSAYNMGPYGFKKKGDKNNYAIKVLQIRDQLSQL